AHDVEGRRARAGRELAGRVLRRERRRVASAEGHAGHEGRDRRRARDVHGGAAVEAVAADVVAEAVELELAAERELEGDRRDFGPAGRGASAWIRPIGQRARRDAGGAGEEDGEDARARVVEAAHLTSLPEAACR